MTQAPLSWLERQIADPEARRVYEEERLVLEANEALLEAMEETQISRAQLADFIGASRAHVSQLLSGTRNLTLRTLARLACALGKQVDIRLTALEDMGFQPIDVPEPTLREPGTFMFEAEELATASSESTGTFPTALAA
jgi:transcriptional regulator with XRE-family HTH domain